MSILRNLGKNRGMSLVEVLVALVVFTIGILAVVRMFPGGFASIKQTENKTFADRLAESELERWKNMTANLPDGILAVDPATGIPGRVDIDPADMSLMAGVDPQSADAFYYSDVNKFRHVVAESTIIPARTTNSFGNAPQYVLGFAPIFWTTPGEPIKVYGGVLPRVDIPSSGIVPVLSGLFQYSIAYDRARLYVEPVGYDRQYLITYSYWKNPGSGQLPVLIRGLSVALTVPGGADYADIPSPDNAAVALKDVTGFIGIQGGSDTVRRKFVLLDDIDPWSDTDPYEYKVGGSSNAEAAALGVLYFNPIGYNFQEVTVAGRGALTAHMDYDVLDWHIIRDERRIPAGATTPGDPRLNVKLTLRFIKKAGETPEADGNIYPGINKDFLPYDVVAVDVQTGAAYKVGNGVSSSFTIDYDNGILTFDPSLSGHTFRIYYKADNDWAVQLYKSYDTYSDSNGNANPTYWQYYAKWDWDTTDNGFKHWRLRSEGNEQRIYLPWSYAKTTVAVDYIYAIQTAPGKWTQTQVVGRAFVVPDSTTEGYLCSINLTDGLPNDAQVIKVSRVAGVSVGVRVIWRTGGRGFIAGRWKKVDLQTYMTKGD